MLPECRLCSAAVDCSTKSHIREIKLSGGRGLPSTQGVRGLPGLAPQEHARVSADNGCADFLLAVQPILAVHDRGAFREKPAIPFIGTTRSSVCSTSLEIGLTSNTRCVFLAPKKIKFQWPWGQLGLSVSVANIFSLPAILVSQMSYTSVTAISRAGSPLHVGSHLLNLLDVCAS